jgi:hypothetical protein
MVGLRRQAAVRAARQGSLQVAALAVVAAPPNGLQRDAIWL